MQAKTLNIQKFDIKTASDSQWSDLIKLSQRLFEERAPGDPVPPEIVMRRNVESEMQSERGQLDIWLVYDDSQENVMATCDMYRMTPKADDYESKKYLAFFDIFVLPEYRRQRIGSQLLEFIAEEAHQDNKTRLEIWVSTRAGDAFMEAKPAENVLQMKTNRLQLSELDWAMVEQWAKEGRERNPDVELLFFDSLPDDDTLQDVAALITHIFSQMPKEGASGFPEMISPESIKERYEQMEMRNFTEINIVTREPDGTMSAMTEIGYQPERPHVLSQGLTGVHLDARGRGLGKWLKAQMLLEARERYPDAQYVDTNNANVNAPMLHINNTLGFKFHRQNTTYKLEVADILKK